jgi:hypothetical protein
MKLFIKQFSPAFYYFIPLGSKYSPEHYLSKTLALFSPLNAKSQVSHPYKTTGKMGFIHLNISVFRQQVERQIILKLITARIP